MPDQILHSALPLPIFMLDRLLQNARAVQAGAFVVGIHIFNADLDEVGHHARVRWLLITADISHDDRPVDPNAHLRTMVLANPHALNEAKYSSQPRHCGADVGIHEHRDDRGGWD